MQSVACSARSKAVTRPICTHQPMKLTTDYRWQGQVNVTVLTRYRRYRPKNYNFSLVKSVVNVGNIAFNVHIGIDDIWPNTLPYGENLMKIGAVDPKISG